jgi:hypothetical protein
MICGNNAICSANSAEMLTCLDREMIRGNNAICSANSAEMLTCLDREMIRGNNAICSANSAELLTCLDHTVFLRKSCLWKVMCFVLVSVNRSGWEGTRTVCSEGSRIWFISVHNQRNVKFAAVRLTWRGVSTYAKGTEESLTQLYRVRVYVWRGTQFDLGWRTSSFPGSFSVLKRKKKT